MTRQKVFELITAEREAQTAKWGPLHQQPLGIGPDSIRLAILTEEVGEVAKAILDGKPVETGDELIQVAAVAVAWLEQLGGVKK